MVTIRRTLGKTLPHSTFGREPKVKGVVRRMVPHKCFNRFVLEDHKVFVTVGLVGARDDIGLPSRCMGYRSS